MSGTSADGIDAVLARLSLSDGRIRARVLAHAYEPFTPALRRHILKVCISGTVAEICELNFALGERFARAALSVIRKAGVSRGRIWGIGSHGQTIQHLPNGRIPSTLQIGEPAIIAERTGVRTVADFRVGDMAGGGQGAPLVPLTDWVLFTDPVVPRIIQNIGGIGNLTFLPPAATLDDVRAFDTGPGNMVMDAIASYVTNGVRQYDKDGRIGARGHVSAALLAEMMEHPFISRKPPKTTGREEFGATFVASILGSARRLRVSNNDLMATATALTAETIVDACQRFILPLLTPAKLREIQVILGGGGAKNPTLRGMLRERLGNIEMLTHEDFGIGNSEKEALAFAILAFHTLLGLPGNVPAATGARHPVVLGKVIPASRAFRS
jgi:anhydro-N-acetylmuramic acid kinase